MSRHRFGTPDDAVDTLAIGLALDLRSRLSPTRFWDAVRVADKICRYSGAGPVTQSHISRAWRSNADRILAR